ncbi:MAG: hypothetical protein MZW92_09620 [Comamonadaceae bacterium]|nr:hypothetical protein [Comamonadaceae bacterium]
MAVIHQIQNFDPAGRGRPRPRRVPAAAVAHLRPGHRTPRQRPPARHPRTPRPARLPATSSQLKRLTSSSDAEDLQRCDRPDPAPQSAPGRDRRQQPRRLHRPGHHR